MNSTEHTISVLSSSSVETSAKEQLSQCPNLMGCQTELDPCKPFSSVFLKGQDEYSTPADWFWIHWPVLFSFFWVTPTNFLYGELVIFFAVPPRVFVSRFQLGTGLISDVWRASEEVNGEKLTEMNRWSSPKQDGSQEQHLCPLRLEGNRLVWRCSCHKERGLSPGGL